MLNGYDFLSLFRFVELLQEAQELVNTLPDLEVLSSLVDLGDLNQYLELIVGNVVRQKPSTYFNSYLFIQRKWIGQAIMPLNAQYAIDIK